MRTKRVYVDVIEVIVISICCYSTKLAVGEFCSENLDQSGSNDLRFSKELSRIEYGIGKHTKSLHCCAANFETIEWSKDDVRYPWKITDTGFRIDAGSRNQTLYTPKLTISDAGTYSCSISNGANTEKRSFELKVFDREFSATPEATYTPPASIKANLKETVKLYCETFVGKIELPDVHYHISWNKLNVNNTRIQLGNTTRTSVIKVIRDDGLTLGLYLKIENIDVNDYGTYVCVVSNTGDQIKEMKSELIPPPSSDQTSSILTSILLMVAAFGGIVIAATAVYLHFGLRILLCIRSKVMREKTDSNKEYDVFVFYERSETHCFNDIMRKLVEYGYRINSHCLKNSSLINVECQTKIVLSRRVIFILSSPEPSNAADKEQFFQKLHVASSLNCTIICVLVQHKPSVAEDEQIFKMIDATRNLELLKWPAYQKNFNRMWWSLRFKLPDTTLDEKELVGQRAATKNSDGVSSV